MNKRYYDIVKDFTFCNLCGAKPKESCKNINYKNKKTPIKSHHKIRFENYFFRDFEGKGKEKRLSFDEAKRFLLKTSDSGLWFDEGVFRIVKDVENGRTDIGRITLKSMKRMKREKIIGPNIYGGFKEKRRIYPRSKDTKLTEEMKLGFQPGSELYHYL